MRLSSKCLMSAFHLMSVIPAQSPRDVASTAEIGWKADLDCLNDNAAKVGFVCPTFRAVYNAFVTRVFVTGRGVAGGMTRRMSMGRKRRWPELTLTWAPLRPVATSWR